MQPEVELLLKRFEQVSDDCADSLLAILKESDTNRRDVLRTIYNEKDIERQNIAREIYRLTK